MLRMAVETLTLAWDGGTVSGAWHRTSQTSTCLVLAHGAGGNLHTPGLVKVAEALTARGLNVMRFNFPYAEARRKVPDRQATLESCYRAVAQQAAERSTRLFLGGRSMGGRIASHIVAKGQSACGLVFFAYPLHPPGKVEQMRDAHLTAISIPMLFLQGTRDPFARPDLLAQTVRRLPHATLHVVEGADHGLTVRGRPADETIVELAETTLQWINSIR